MEGGGLPKKGASTVSLFKRRAWQEERGGGVFEGGGLIPQMHTMKYTSI